MKVLARKHFFKNLAAIRGIDVIDDIEFIYDFAR